jgi:hypothetical protein
VALLVIPEGMDAIDTGIRRFLSRLIPAIPAGGDGEGEEDTMDITAEEDITADGEAMVVVDGEVMAAAVVVAAVAGMVVVAAAEDVNKSHQTGKICDLIIIHTEGLRGLIAFRPPENT